MSARVVGLILLLVGSLLLGLALGEWNFGLFRQTVPPVALSNFNTGAAHVAYLLYGAAAGVAVFLWALLAVGLARFFPGKSKAAAGPK
jgi:hypothetical protein